MATYRDPVRCFAPLEVIERLLEIRAEAGYAPAIYLLSPDDLAETFGNGLGKPGLANESHTFLVSPNHAYWVVVAAYIAQSPDTALPKSYRVTLCPRSFSD